MRMLILIRDAHVPTTSMIHRAETNTMVCNYLQWHFTTALEYYVLVLYSVVYTHVHHASRDSTA